jgi:hypothetical protein
MNWNEKFQRQAAFFVVTSVGVLVTLYSLANDLGMFGGGLQPLDYVKIGEYVLALACLVVGLTGWVRTRRYRHKTKRLWAPWGYLISAAVLLLFSWFHLRLSFSVDKSGAMIGLLLGVLSITVGLSFSLFGLETQFIDRFDELQRQNISKGFLVHIDKASLWRFQGTIVGWNPNWALELKVHPDNVFAQQLAEVHRDRLRHPEVRSIEYIFLEGYDPDGDDGLKFGLHWFLEFLTQKFSKERSLIFERYRIWEISENLWKGCREETGANRQLFDAIKPFLGVIVIAGTRNGRDHAVMFFNMPQFTDVEGHTRCLEINDDEFEFFASWQDIRDKMEQCKIPEQKVQWNKKAKKFELLQRSPTGATLTASTSGTTPAQTSSPS